MPTFTLTYAEYEFIETALKTYRMICQDAINLHQEETAEHKIVRDLMQTRIAYAEALLERLDEQI